MQFNIWIRGEVPCIPGTPFGKFYFGENIWFKGGNSECAKHLPLCWMFHLNDIGPDSILPLRCLRGLRHLFYPTQVPENGLMHLPLQHTII